MVLVAVRRLRVRRLAPQRRLPLLRRLPPPLVHPQNAVRRLVEGTRVVPRKAQQAARSQAVGRSRLGLAVARRAAPTLAPLAAAPAAAEGRAKEARVPMAAATLLSAVEAAAAAAASGGLQRSNDVTALRALLRLLVARRFGR